MRLNDIFNESLLGKRPEGPDLTTMMLDEWMDMTQPAPDGFAARRLKVSGFDHEIIVASLTRSRLRNPNAWVHLTNLIVHPPEARKMGYATDAMEIICRLADKHRVGVELTAEPMNVSGSKMNLGSLLQFYTKFGFENMGMNTMFRKPINPDEA